MADRTPRPPVAPLPMSWRMSRPTRWLPALALLVATQAMLATQAHAEERGVVVRLRAAGKDASAVVTVRLTTPAGEPVEATLSNDGVAPDVAQGDDAWAGGTTIDGNTVTATVSVNGRAYAAATTTWGAVDDARELALVLDGETVTVTAAVAGVSRAGAAGGPRNEGGGESSPLALGAGLAVGVFGLLAIAFAWMRAGQPSDTAAPFRIVGVATLAGPALPGERALPGEGGPSSASAPSNAPCLATWVAAEPEAALLPVLSLLAERHRVLVVVPTARAIPPVVGGPVYTLAETDPFRVADDVAVFARLASRPLAVVVVGGTAATWAPVVESLPPGARVVLLVGPAEAPAEAPAEVAADVTADVLGAGTARVERDGAGWVVRDGATVLPLGEGPRRLRAARAAG